MYSGYLVYTSALELFFYLFLFYVLLSFFVLSTIILHLPISFFSLYRKRHGASLRFLHLFIHLLLFIFFLFTDTVLFLFIFILLQYLFSFFFHPISNCRPFEAKHIQFRNIRTNVFIPRDFFSVFDSFVTTSSSQATGSPLIFLIDKTYQHGMMNPGREELAT